MARYVTHVRTPLPPTEAFSYMADLRHFAQWDPGVVSVAQVNGEGAGPDAAFDVRVAAGPGRTMVLRYVTELFEAPREVLVVARNRFLTSEDRIVVAPDDAGPGSVVTYDADLRLSGLFRLADPFLALAFRRIGDRAAAGLRAALDGVPAP